jgi:hypothetical protein
MVGRVAQTGAGFALVAYNLRNLQLSDILKSFHFVSGVSLTLNNGPKVHPHASVVVDNKNIGAVALGALLMYDGLVNLNKEFNIL